MRSILTLSCFAIVGLSLVACAVDPVSDEEDALSVENALKQNDDHTTRDICTKCGCVAKELTCDCGTPPRPKKLECIKNGGPSKLEGVFSGSYSTSSSGGFANTLKSE